MPTENFALYQHKRNSLQREINHPSTKMVINYNVFKKTKEEKIKLYNLKYKWRKRWLQRVKKAGTTKITYN